MSAVAVVTNPRSRHNRRNPDLGPALAYVLGEKGELVSPHDLSALAATAERFRERGVEVVCVNGGDGTIHQVLTALVRAYGEAPLPAFAVLRGGTMNIVADSVGVRVDARSMLGEVVEALHGGAPLPTTARRALKVELDDQPPFYGFLSGNGIIARFLEVYYERPEPTPIDAAWLLARGAASAMVGGALIRRLTRPYSGRVAVDGAELPGERWVATAIGSIEQMGLGFRVFSRLAEDPDRFQYVALGGSVADTARELPSLYRGRGVHRPKDRSDLAGELVLTSGEPIQLMIDGDFYVAQQGRVRYTLGPSVRFLLPSPSSR
jgi:diacylglycerol kinase family enzyme